MAQNQQNDKLRVVVTNAATGEIVTDWTESTVVVIASDIMDVSEGGKASSHVFICGKPSGIAQLMADDDDLRMYARLALMIREFRAKQEEEAQ